MYQDDFISPKAATSVSTLIVLNPEKCPGQYRCQVTFKMNYNGEEMTLCTQSEPANLEKVPETSGKKNKCHMLHSSHSNSICF